MCTLHFVLLSFPLCRSIILLQLLTTDTNIHISNSVPLSLACLSLTVSLSLTRSIRITSYIGYVSCFNCVRNFSGPYHIWMWSMGMGMGMTKCEYGNDNSKTERKARRCGAFCFESWNQCGCKCECVHVTRLQTRSQVGKTHLFTNSRAFISFVQVKHQFAKMVSIASVCMHCRIYSFFYVAVVAVLFLLLLLTLILLDVYFSLTRYHCIFCSICYLINYVWLNKRWCVHFSGLKNERKKKVKQRFVHSPHTNMVDRACNAWNALFSLAHFTFFRILAICLLNAWKQKIHSYTGTHEYIWKMCIHFHIGNGITRQNHQHHRKIWLECRRHWRCKLD